MAVGFILISTAAATFAAILAAATGGGWLGAFAAYFLAGMATSALLILRALICDRQAREPAPECRIAAAAAGGGQNR